jgi:hypothetical protein
MRIASGEEPEDYGPNPESEGRDPAAVALGRKGGKARAEGLSKKRRKEIARQAAEKRWSPSSPRPWQLTGKVMEIADIAALIDDA